MCGVWRERTSCVPFKWDSAYINIRSSRFPGPCEIKRKHEVDLTGQSPLRFAHHIVFVIEKLRWNWGWSPLRLDHVFHVAEGEVQVWLWSGMLWTVFSSLIIAVKLVRQGFRTTERCKRDGRVECCGQSAILSVFPSHREVELRTVPSRAWSSCFPCRTEVQVCLWSGMLWTVFSSLIIIVKFDHHGFHATERFSQLSCQFFQATKVEVEPRRVSSESWSLWFPGLWGRCSHVLHANQSVLKLLFH